MELLHFDEAAHTYTVAGQRLPSVTQLLAPIKPDFSMVPPDVLEAKRAFGTAVHTACELDDLDELDDAGTDPRVMACVQAWRRFRADTGAAILLNEQRLYHPALRFAGTVDRLVFMRQPGGDQRGAWLIDLKTSDEPHPSYGVQLAGYSMLLSAQQDASLPASPVQRATVHLRDDGTYRFHRFANPNDEACFMACLALNTWKESHQ